MKRSSYIILILISTFVSSCMSATYVPFSIVNKDFKTKGQRVAVIAALHKNDTYLFSREFEKELIKCSSYKIITQQTIKRKIANYPTKIQGPYKTAFTKINHDLTQTDVATLCTIGKKINVDYVYAFWTPILELSPDFGIYQLHTVMQIFEVSSGKEIARMKFPITWHFSGISGLPKTKSEAMQTIAQRLSRKVAEDMKVLKK